MPPDDFHGLCSPILRVYQKTLAGVDGLISEIFRVHKYSLFKFRTFKFYNNEFFFHQMMPG